MWLKTEGYLEVCMEASACAGDERAYRLMFWEDVSDELVTCLARGIMPIFLRSQAIHEYVDRNVVLLPYSFETPEEMKNMVELLASPLGVLNHGTQTYQSRETNQILSQLYWRQDLPIRAVISATNAYHMQHFGLPAARKGLDVAELVVCVESAPGNTLRRKIIRETWARENKVLTRFGMVRLRLFFFMADVPEAHEERASHGDIVVLQHLEEGFATIWLKTAAILKFGADYFRGRYAGGEDPDSGVPLVRFLFKCDDDAFVDIDATLTDLLDSSPLTALYWGHIMAQVEPNRVEGDKYYVPYNIVPTAYFPTYARGMAYALSEDLVLPLGAALENGTVDPFPYREDVSVGFYLFALAQRGGLRVIPRQRFFSMPVDFPFYCAEGGVSPVIHYEGYQPPADQRLLVLHRFNLEDAACLWGQIQARRAAHDAASAAPMPPTDFCSCSSPPKASAAQ